ncbi:Hypothetical protein NTJ_06408 [Nesidiocoris tenuis]|uniref:Uncharacterized protein n=1 Tax=Nesidiocoris tenuis TaxID=355587 RepID=A0ABN7AQN4_9HEMI|nr:Hypothetical protein NTJ_06408 [Nesidiocoris tenuis]
MREVKIRVRVIHPKNLKRLHLKVIVRTKRGAGETVEKDFEIDLTHGTPISDKEPPKSAKPGRALSTDKGQKSSETSASSENED